MAHLCRLATMLGCCAAWFASVACGCGLAGSLEESVGNIDRLLAEHWQRRGVVPAPVASDGELFRRTTLDLLGRLPTLAEVQAWEKEKGQAATATGDRHAAVVERWLASPEFSLQLAAVLDEFIQGRQAGLEPFVDYLRQAMLTGKSWDTLFRELLAGGGESAAPPAAALFVDKRSKDLDQLTVDTARAFFGVDISCARCHDHPLVPDWTQRHYYGLAAFLQRPAGDGQKKKADAAGTVTFLGRDGQQHVAAPMFLSGSGVATPEEPGPKRRRQLVELALAERQFLSRALVNRLWEYFLGRGFVEPVDQLHTGNPASIPELLDFLAQEVVDRQYDVRQLVRLVMLSRAYRASSQWESAAAVPDPGDFAVMRLRPLSPRQFGLSLLATTGETQWEETDPLDQRVERLFQANGASRVRQVLNWESSLPPLIKELDPRVAGFQSSAREALFVTNGEPLRRLLAPAGRNLAVRLSESDDARQATEQAYRVLLQRSPDDEERSRCIEFLQSWNTSASRDASASAATDPPIRDAAQSGEATSATRSRPPAAACAELIWIIVSSAEFRFNH
ncbi:MAG: DUF1553 domain-containing protein [Pirellulales bacterium]